MFPRKYTENEMYPFKKKQGKKKHVVETIKDFIVYTRIEKILPFIFVIIVFVGIGMYIMKPTYYEVLPKMPYINSVKEKVDEQLDIIADVAPILEQEHAQETAVPHTIEGLTGKMKVKTEDGGYNYYLLFANRVQRTDKATYDAALVPIPQKIQDGNKSVELEPGLVNNLGNYYKLIDAVERKSR